MKLTTILLASAAMLAATCANAQTVSTAGTRIDTGASWRSVDPFGQAGYYIPGGQRRVAVPTFVSSIATTSEVYPGNDGYATIDDPFTTPGAMPSSILSGTFNPFPGPGNQTTPFSFTIGSNAPQVIRVGLLFDNLDFAAFNSSSVSLTGPGTSSASFDLSGSDFNNRAPDWVFFNISGAASGDVYNVVTTGGPNGCGCLGGVSFDAGKASVGAVPEPATWAMMVMGFGMVGFGLRRRSKVSTKVSFA